MEQLVFDFYTQQPQISAAANDELSLQIGEFAGPFGFAFASHQTGKSEYFRHSDCENYRRISEIYSGVKALQSFSRGGFSWW